MRRSLILLLAVAALAAPGAALAADPTPVTGHYFEIVGISVGGTKIEIAGKLALEGTRLMASVGCNSIGGDVAVDGDVLTPGQLVTTDMACTGDIGTADAALVKFFNGGPITMAATTWTNAVGVLSVKDAGTSVIEPAPTDGGIVVSPPDPGTSFDPGFTGSFSLDQCVGILPADEFPSMTGGGSGSGSGSSGSSTGSGTTDPGTIGSGSGGAPAPDATGSLDQGTGTTPADGGPDAPPPDASPIAVDPIPLPYETASDLPLPIETPVVDPLPAPSVGPDASAAVPTLEQCRALVSSIKTFGGPAAGGAPVPAVDTNLESAHDAGQATPVMPFVVTILALAAVAFVTWRRSRTPAAAQAGADAGTDADRT
jgi:heat shock protein HslJ